MDSASITPTPEEADVVEIERNDRSVRFYLPGRETDHIQRMIAEQRAFYEIELLEAIEDFIHEGDLVLDVGAHVGNHSLFFASQCGADVIAFEANEETRALLERQVELNDFASRISVRACAVGRTGRGRLIPGPESNSGKSRVSVDEQGAIPIVALDEVELPRPPRLLKIDVEGMELDVLEGARTLLSEHHPLLAVECQTLAMFEAVAELLAHLGYAARHVVAATPTALFIAAPDGDPALAAAVAASSVHFSLRELRRRVARESMHLSHRVEAADQATRARFTRQETHLAALEQQHEELLRAAAAHAASNTELKQRLSALDEHLQSLEESYRMLQAETAKIEEVRRHTQELVEWSRTGLAARLLEPGAQLMSRTVVGEILDPQSTLGRKTRKLLRDPDAFFADSKRPFLRDRLGPGVAVIRRGSSSVIDGGTRLLGAERAERLQRKGGELRRGLQVFLRNSSTPLLRRAPAWGSATVGGQPSSTREPPAVASPRVVPKRSTRVELAMPRRSFVVAAANPAAIPISGLTRLAERIGDDAELIVSTHVATPDTFRSLLAAASSARARLYFHYEARSRDELISYAVDRAATDAPVIADESRPAAALSGHGAGPGDAISVDTAPHAATVLRLGRAPVLLTHRDWADTVERMLAERSRHPRREFDLYGEAARFQRVLPQHVIGDLPATYAFEIRGDDRYFCYHGPTTTAPVVCLETKPSWLSDQVERLDEQKVSVVMTVFNAEDTVEAAIASVLDQSHGNLELIVVDDCSSDGSFERVRACAKHDPRIRQLRSPSNRGTYWCKNLGLLHATGEFVTFQDSDDLSAEHRLALQHAALQAFPDRVAVMTRYQRIEPSGRVLRGRLSTERPGLVTAMFRRSAVLQQFGFFDSVRVSADDELIARIRAAGGRILTLPSTSYFARHVPGSLTTTAETAVTAIDGRAQRSPAREAYWQGVLAWHARIRAGEESPYMPFPLTRRRFPAPIEILPRRSDEPAEGETVTASMATMPSRVDCLRTAVESLLPQVDRLNVFLNEFDSVPAFLHHPKIRVARSQDVEDLKDNGKFYFTPDLAPGYHLTVDDDIIYPPDYVQRSILAIEAYGRRAVVGVHGVNLAEPLEHFLQGREVLHFQEALDRDRLVHLLGTGTIAYHTSTLDIHLEDFQTKGVADLWLAIYAREHGVPLVAQRRPRRWLRVIPNETEKLYRTHLADGVAITEIARRHGPWPRTAHTEGQQELVTHLLERHPPRMLGAARVDLRECYQACVREPLRLTLIVPGWNCAEEAEGCWQSIVEQAPGPFEWEAHIIDDASTDGTWDVLQALPADGRVHLHRSKRNRGPAYSRLQLIRAVEDPEAICVLLDLDDQLAPQALLRVAERYLENPRCRMTFGDWISDAGKHNPLDFHARETYLAGTYRLLRKFRLPHLRSFRRSLADRLEDWQFHGPDGKWLRYCSDLALVLPLIEQCEADEIEHIREITYIYNERRPTGTLTRFGGNEKQAMHEWLCRNTGRARAAHPG